MSRREYSRHAGVITTNNGSTHHNRLNPRGVLVGMEEVLRQHRHLGWGFDTLPDSWQESKSDDRCPRCLRPLWLHSHTPHPGDDGFPFLRVDCTGSLHQLVDDGAETVDCCLQAGPVVALFEQPLPRLSMFPMHASAPDWDVPASVLT